MNLQKLVIFAGVSLILLSAAWLRLFSLEDRPVHGDEANQAIKAGILLERGEYRYDPHEHHGPTLYYLTLPILWLSGTETIQQAEIWQFRLLTALFGIGVVGLAFLFKRWLGVGAALWAAAFTAVSHALAFYSRYFVQEMLFVFFALLLLYAWLRLLETKSLIWAITLGAAAGLLHATKETCVFVFAALAAATFLAYLPRIKKWKDSHESRDGIYRFSLLFLLSLSVAVAISITFFSSFFTWWRGPLDSLLTYLQYVHRAEGQGSAAFHDKPFWYYWALLSFTYRDVGPRWSEAPVLLFALLGSARGFFRRAAPEQRGPRRLVVFYAWILALLLSLVPYKTPWNLLIFYQPLLLLAGLGIQFLLDCARPRWFKVLPAAFAVVCLLFMLQQTWRGLTTYNADTRNPYVYAHPSSDLVRMISRIKEIAALTPENHGTHINVIQPNGDYWPLPWYLRRFSRVGYFIRVPSNADAPLIVAPPSLHQALEDSLQDKYFVQIFSLRPNVLLNLYIRQDLWDQFMAGRRTAL